jgi:uncharacterized membrane protein YbhN (UPF0104 family)
MAIIRTVTGPSTTEPTTGASPRRSAGARLLGALPTVLAVVLLVAAGRWFAARWAAVVGEGPAPTIAWGWIALAFALLLTQSVLLVTVWQRLLGAVGASLPWRTAADSIVPSLLARYVPGKVWANAARLALARRAGVALGVTTGALVWEALLGLSTTSVLAVAGLYGRTDQATFRSALLLLVLTIAGWGVAAVIARTPNGAALLRRFGGTAPVSRPAAIAPAFALSLVGLLFFAGAHLAVAIAVAPASLIGITDFPLVAGAVALAWAAGFLAFVMPVGLGVRDGLLLLLLAPLLDSPQALLLVALSRLVQLAVDGTITALWLLDRTMRRR